ncbi:sortilin-related receptor-like [Paramacrobiotus metropolitanus]|uniref:sortilin-related receptor-like n=1 Tax=Paramacrobiotus metropolitanus TaxID=2943436 RepID=UPI002445F3FB|nr:sortilin-related receptor-like [Paramacrobiotus metropolitanus]
MALKFYNVCSMPLVLQLVVLNILVRGQNLGLEKPGRCASVSGKCSAGPSPSSRCFFHFECPGKQLCCSIDGCINACVDPVLNFNDSRISDLLSRSDMLLSAADNAYVLNPNVVQKGPYLKCKAGLLIKTSYRCNGKNDCPDGDNSDEMDCPCSADEVLCTNGLCVNLAAVCLPTGTRNGLCSVPSLNCSSINCSSSDHFRCNNGQCVPLNNRCDGIFSCLDGSDEQDCACSSGNFNCDDGLCKSLLNVWCNGAADCSDRSDESANCSCIPGQFTCTNGRCIPQYKKCDFIDDCLDGSDETDCTVKCTASNKLFQCGSGQCIPVYSQCDGFPDCQDASDESNCVDNKPNNCHRAGYFSCGNSSSTVEKCVPLSAWCDGVTDCPDHTDEPLFCSTTCPNASMSCDGGRCISLASKCDGKVDCTDKTDESGCQCQENELPLPNSACLARDKFCNGVRDAANGLDEEQCRACKERLAQNFPGKLCDGIIDCPDASDELFCGHCTTAQFFCQKSHQCIFRNQTCDGYPDCNPYGEDEETCLGVTPAPCHIDADMTSIQSERAGCLTVRNRGEWMPVCAERWLSSLSDAICEIMGYDKSLSTNLVPMEPGEIPERPLKMPRQFDGAQLVISAAFSCPSRKKVYLECGSLLCGQSLPDNGLPKYITGYNKVAAGEHPWSALLYQDGKYICSAVIVDAEWVLTSAKCVATIDLASSFVVVRVGMIRRFSRNANEQFLPVDFIAMHPNFTVSINPEIATADADLALLHLAVPVHWNAFAKPVCLPRSSDPQKVLLLPDGE